MLKSFIRFVITLAMIAGISYGGYLFVMHTIETHSFVPRDETASPTDYIRLEIVSGMRAADVIDILYEEDLIRHDIIASLIVRFRGWGRIQVGEYQVHAGLSLADMFDMFSDGDVARPNVTYVIIPEGLLITRIAELFGETLGIDDEELLELWADEDFLVKLIDEYWFLTDDILNPDLLFPLEGYIIPIRHEIPEGETDLSAITRAILNMTERILGYYQIRGYVENQALTFHELLSFAAIVQGETGRADQMADVAGVFWNRLEAGMTWQSDVSAQYLLDERVVHVLYEHLTVDSPFNTYHHPGIPIGPMNNPSIPAILAVVEPSEHEYVFFITNMFGCIGEQGEKLFTVTFAEHEHNIHRYLTPAYNNNGICP
ncbi:MAG: endolytic transglycosylase MltG [Defluviitaleaceae bacterium]|nr:endolytic transglycosylase MltG [Defluviitaleaceae bacterium]